MYHEVLRNLRLLNIIWKRYEPGIVSFYAAMMSSVHKGSPEVETSISDMSASSVVNRVIVLVMGARLTDDGAMGY
jgi:hypothetical protein